MTATAGETSQPTPPMEAGETIAALWLECDRWSRLAADFQQIADTGFAEGSRAQLDTAAAAVIDPPPVVSHYLQERAWNTARMLRSLHRWVFDTEPGQLHLDTTVMYPLMRAALEDTATIVWLQESSSRDDRLTRALRSLHQDALYFSKNHLLLAATAGDRGGNLSAHIRQEQEDFRSHFADLTDRLGLDPRDVTSQLATSAPATAVYGRESIERVTWGMLSDLSHFSYMMLRHLATSPVPGSTVRLLHVTVLQFAQTLNPVSDDAIEALRRAAEPSGRPEEL